MYKANLWGSSVLSVFSVIVFYNARTTMPYMDEFGPGSGFLPTWTAALMFCLSILWMLNTLKVKEKNKQFISNKRAFLKMTYVFISLVIGIVLIRYIGFYATLIALAVVIMYLIERVSLKITLISTSFVIFSIYCIFSLWLRVPFPKGLW